MNDQPEQAPPEEKKDKSVAMSWFRKHENLIGMGAFAAVMGGVAWYLKRM